MSEDAPEAEHLAPPAPRYFAGMPDKAARSDRDALDSKLNRKGLFDFRKPRASIALAAARFEEGCLGGGAYANNCAHFLSNAFIDAGYSELLTNTAQIKARCGPDDCHPPPRQGRPIRARNMHEWFKVMGGTNRRVFPRNSQEQFIRTMTGKGMWAVFELDEESYWGGHVCIVDTDAWKVYGTGMHGYWDWAQYCYQW